MEKLTYKDFKIGQKITCVKIDNDFYDQHLTKGKIYIVEDTDFHFPYKICIRSDNNKISMFMPIEFFSNDLKIIRKIKLEKLENK